MLTAETEFLTISISGTRSSEGRKGRLRDYQRPMRRNFSLINLKSLPDGISSDDAAIVATITAQLDLQCYLPIPAEHLKIFCYRFLSCYLSRRLLLQAAFRESGLEAPLSRLAALSILLPTPKRPSLVGNSNLAPGTALESVSGIWSPTYQAALSHSR